MRVRHLEQWRDVAQERGFRQDSGGWLTPGGQRVSAEFVERVCIRDVVISSPVVEHLAHIAPTSGPAETRIA